MEWNSRHSLADCLNIHALELIGRAPVCTTVRSPVVCRFTHLHIYCRLILVVFTSDTPVVYIRILLLM